MIKETQMADGDILRLFLKIRVRLSGAMMKQKFRLLAYLLSDMLRHLISRVL